MGRIKNNATLFLLIVVLSGCRKVHFSVPNPDEVSFIRITRRMTSKNEGKAVISHPVLEVREHGPVVEILSWMKTIDFSKMEDTQGTAKLVDPRYLITIVYSSGNEVSFAIRNDSIWKNDRHFWRADVQKFEEIITRILKG